MRLMGAGDVPSPTNVLEHGIYISSTWALPGVCLFLPGIYSSVLGSAKFITQFDLLKCYLQVSFWHRAREIAAFITLTGLDSCLALPFGLHNAQFNWFMNKASVRAKCVRALANCFPEEHLTANLTKYECAKATVTYLGWQVEQDKVSLYRTISSTSH